MSGDLVEGGEITGFKITPDSLGVVYLANKEEKDEVYLTRNYQYVVSLPALSR